MKKILIEVLLTIIFISVVIVSDIIIIKKATSEENSDSNNNFKEQIINIEEEIDLAGYTRFEIDEITYPDTEYYYSLYYSEKIESSIKTIEVNNSNLEVGSIINLGQLLGKNDLNDDVFATENGVVLNVSSNQITYFSNKKGILYSYISLWDIRNIQQCKNIVAMNSEENIQYPLKISKIDTSKLLDNSAYVEFEIELNANDSLFEFDSVLFYNEMKTFYGIKKYFSNTYYSSGHVVKGYIIDNNQIQEISIVLGQTNGEYYEIQEVRKKSGEKTINVDLSTLEYIYYKK